MENINLLLAFIISLAVIIGMIMSKKFVPSFCLFVGAVIAAIIAQIPIDTIPGVLNNKFAGILVSTGILMLFAFIFTQYLNESGGIVEFAKALVRIVGYKYDLVAISIVGYILAIPVGFMACIAIVVPMFKPMTKLTGRPMQAYISALVIPCLLSACTVIPTSGPVLVAGLLNLDLGWFMTWGIIITFPIAIINIFVSYWISNKYKNKKTEETEGGNEQLDLTADPAKPGPVLILMLIMIPIVLIILGAFAPLMIPEDSAISQIIKLIGDPSMAMFIISVISMLTLNKYLPRPNVAVFNEGIREAGPVLVILGCASAYGGILQESGVGEYIVGLMSGFNMPVLMIACILMVALHAGTGAGTVAAVTTIPLLLSMFETTNTPLMLFGLLMGVGQLIFLIPTDLTFWFIKDLSGLSMKDMIVSVCVPSTIAGLIGFVIIMIMNSLPMGTFPGI